MRRKTKGSGLVSGLGRRAVLQGTAAVAAGLALPSLVAGGAGAQTDGVLDTLSDAQINWRQAEGAAITIGVIPAGYFNNLQELLPQFTELTGIDVAFEMTPPGQIRQKAVLDLSSGTGNWASHAADPMYYELYVANGWVDRLDRYLSDETLTDAEWFDYEDILAGWRGAVSVDDTPYGIPYDGEATLQVYRTDVYDELGLAPAETLDEYASNAAAVNDPGSRLWGAALRGFKGAGQNMYIYPSIFLAHGGKWFDGEKLVVNGPEAVSALEWYVDLLNSYSPDGVQNWNWPDIADAFGQGTLGSYIDANSSAAVIANPESSQVVGKIGFARWPKGPSGRRVTSIWTWSFPINAALSEQEKTATWLFIQWAASKEVQAATSYAFDGAYKRLGVNRASTWEQEPFREMLADVGDNFIDASTASLQEDTDVDWRPRLPQWPAVGETMATAIQASLVGQAGPQEALDQAQEKIASLMDG